MRRAFATASALAGLAWGPSARAQIAPPAPETLAVGEWRLAPVLELRARGEYRHDLDSVDRGLVLERSRLGLEAGRGPLEARVVLQDARVLDLPGGADVVAGPAAVSVTGAYEAWAEAHTGPASATFVRVGRQPMVWGEGRLLGADDWSPRGRSLDAVRGRLAVGDAAFELLAAALSEPVATPAVSAYGELLGARAEWAVDPLLAFEAYGLARFAQVTPQESLDVTVRGTTYTGALRVHGDGRGWAYGAEAAYQLGQVDDTGANRSAWAVAGRLGYAFERALLAPALRAGFAYASGEDGGSTYRGFDPLLPDVHVWHGGMDLFAWSNEAEASLRASLAPWPDAVAAVEYRYVRLAQPGGTWRSAYLTALGRSPGNTQAELGHEIDATLAWSPWAPLDLTGGYCAIVLGDGARAITRLPQQVSHLGLLQVTLHVP